MMWAYHDKILPFNVNYSGWSMNIKNGIGMGVQSAETTDKTVTTNEITPMKATRHSQKLKERIVRFINFNYLAHAFFIEGKEIVEQELLQFLNKVTTSQ